MPHMSRAADVVLQKTLSNMVPAGLTCRGSLCGGSVEHFFVVLRTEVVRFVSDQGSGGRLGSIGDMDAFPCDVRVRSKEACPF
jgi:hypothetical protein